jgi:thiamine biosynthesis lipoprotein
VTRAAERRRVEHIWGTAISVDVPAPVEPAVLDRAFAWFHRVDDLFSTWRPDTEISRIGRGELALHDTSTEVQDVLGLCDELLAASHGAFDVRFAANPRVERRDGFAPVDPSGIVKGWALDRAADGLREEGVADFAIAAGGDVVTGGRPRGEHEWRIGIQHPHARDAVAAVVEVSDIGVATSGRYERGDHIVDPRTGAPATSLTSVTVVAENLALADACATATVVLGGDGLAWVTDEMGLPAMVIDNDDRVVTNTAFDRLRRA